MTAKILFDDGGPLTNRIGNFFTNKTIQRQYNFLVYFDESLEGEKPTGVFSKLGAFHCTGVELPEYSFKKEYIYYGNFVKSFPILDHNGFEFTMKFEEDEDSTIRSFIQKLIRRQIGSDGYYKSYKETVLERIVISVYTPDGWNSFKIYMKNCYFLKASTANYAYSSSDKIEYDITFNCDHYVVVPHKGAINPEENESRFNNDYLDQKRINQTKFQK